jgi:hypothetical protein
LPSQPAGQAYPWATAVVAAAVCLTLTPPKDVAAQAFVSTDKQQYAIDENVVVSFSGMSGSPSDWISIAVSGSGVTSFVTYKYTGGAISGSLTLVAPLPGTYVARTYFNNSYTLEAESAPFIVEAVLLQGLYGLTLTTSSEVIAPTDPNTGLPLVGNPPEYATVSASVTRSVPYPYDVYIFDQTVGTTGPNLRVCYHANPCSVRIPHVYVADGPHEFVAYVAKLSATLPPNEPLDMSNMVEVSLQEFRFKALTVDGDYLTATMNQPTFATGVSINFYNLTTQRLVRSCGDTLGFDTCSAYIGPPTNQPQLYIAYVSKYSPTPLPPDIRATSNTVIR